MQMSSPDSRKRAGLPVGKKDCVKKARHFKEDTTLTTMHGQAVKSEQLKQKSYFTIKENKINKNIDKSDLAVFKALYWITKEANLESKSSLSLLEELGVKEIKSFSTRSEKNTKRDDSINRRCYQNENC